MNTIHEPKKEALLKRRQALIPQGILSTTPASVQSAKGSLIRDIDGRELIDFAAGIGVMNIGHCVDEVVSAIKDQAEQLLHSCFSVAMNENYMNLAEKLVSLLPHGGPTKVMLTNCGAEAVENAIKIARMATGKPGVLCFTGCFHGRTYMALSLTSTTKYKTDCGPFAPEVFRLEFPDYYRYGVGMSEEQFLENEIAKLNTFSYQYSSNIAAVIIEVVQGEGGFRAVPKKYLHALRTFCDKIGALLIIDEVQSGFGRTGNWGAYQEMGVVPDISTWAKSMGGGMPIGCVMGKAEIMDKAIPGTLGGTYLGNPVCVAASLATIDYMEKVDINALGKKVGKTIHDRFTKWLNEHPSVGTIRGMGAMLGIELVKNKNPLEPDSELASALVKECHQNGLIIITSGMNGNIIRVLSPLTIDDKTLNRGLDILEARLYSRL